MLFAVRARATRALPVLMPWSRHVFCFLGCSLQQWEAFPIQKTVFSSLCRFFRVWRFLRFFRNFPVFPVFPPGVLRGSARGVFATQIVAVLGLFWGLSLRASYKDGSERSPPGIGEWRFCNTDCRPPAAAAASPNRAPPRDSPQTRKQTAASPTLYLEYLLQ